MPPSLGRPATWKLIGLAVTPSGSGSTIIAPCSACRRRHPRRQSLPTLPNLGAPITWHLTDRLFFLLRPIIVVNVSLGGQGCETDKQGGTRVQLRAIFPVIENDAIG